ncbi:MAG: MBL fold metallo-hydrolase [Candidatus Pacebacteria bacterium]|nr:MBL fold metallo-hydrolase [Candidatus Paceibacterota bacterium]
MQIQTLKVGQLRTNCYLVSADLSLDCLIIDPGDDADIISEEIMRQNLEPQAIIATHGHYDHVLASRELQLGFEIPFFVRQADQFLVDKMKKSAEYWSSRTIIEEPPKVGRYLEPGQEIEFGQEQLTVFPAPGHTPGGICLYNQEQRIIFSGDTVFGQGLVGRTDLPYSNPADLRKTVKTIKSKFEGYDAYPGHGDSFIV